VDDPIASEVFQVDWLLAGDNSREDARLKSLRLLLSRHFTSDRKECVPSHAGGQYRRPESADVVRSPSGPERRDKVRRFDEHHASRNVLAMKKPTG
jgi:hypothetical protein